LQHFTQTSEHILFVEKGEGEERARRKEDFATFSANVRHSFLSSLFFFFLVVLVVALVVFALDGAWKSFWPRRKCFFLLVAFRPGTSKKWNDMRTEWKWNSDRF